MPGKEAIPIGCSAIKPVERHGWEAVSWFLYDKNTGAIMGRTPLSWLLITIFYIIYYSCLAGFWALMLFIFFQTIDNEVPKWTHDSGSLIGRSPALGVRPAQNWEHIDSSMIIFNKNKKKDGKTIPGYAQWVERTNMFLEENGYQTTTMEKDWNGKDIKVVTRQQELTNLGPCSGEQDPDFGYSTGQPCILLKLNKIYGLQPEYITDTDNYYDMPRELRLRIAAARNKHQVWVSCTGENAADQEGMGEIEYFPSDGGFDSAYYPYMNDDGYRSPLIAVRFKEPAPFQFLHVECRAWAGNIKYHRRDRVGIAHFELMMHTDETAKKVDGTLAKE